jgi:RNA polymerase sigma factor (sigma-70 family)
VYGAAGETVGGDRRTEPDDLSVRLWGVAIQTAAVTIPTAEAVPREFDEFYRSKRDHLARALAMTLRDDELGNEAADEAMTRAYQRWRTVREYANPVGWAYRVGFNWAISRKRKARREVVVAVPERRIEDSDFIPEIEAALAEIPVDQRAVLVLRFYLDWDIKRVAEALRIPIGTVKSRQKRGLAAVERRLEVRR